MSPLAYVPILISVFAAAMAAISVRISLRTRRSAVEIRLADWAQTINDSFIKYDVRTPYATLNNIPSEANQEFAKKCVMLLHQLNLLHEVFYQRGVLGAKAVEGYRKWAVSVIAPWVAEDADLAKVLSTYMRIEDWKTPGFEACLLDLAKAANVAVPVD
jgi:hypothetical protein